PVQKFCFHRAVPQGWRPRKDGLGAGATICYAGFVVVALDIISLLPAAPASARLVLFIRYTGTASLQARRRFSAVHAPTTTGIETICTSGSNSMSIIASPPAGGVGGRGLTLS